MDLKLKYIIFDNNKPVIFSELISHDCMIAKNDYVRLCPTSAGFITLVPISSTKEKQSFINVTCHGESISLGIKSNGDADEKIIKRYLNGEDD